MFLIANSSNLDRSKISSDCKGVKPGHPFVTTRPIPYQHLTSTVSRWLSRVLEHASTFSNNCGVIILFYEFNSEIEKPG